MTMGPTIPILRKQKCCWNSLAVAFWNLGLMTALAVSVTAQPAQSPAGSGVGVAVRTQDPSGKEVRFAVAHQHAFSWCYGYLYVSADKIRFEVVQPQANSNHSFEVP